MRIHGADAHTSTPNCVNVEWTPDNHCGIPDLLRLEKISPRGMYAGNVIRLLISASGDVGEALE